jgi:hypothetical protein
MSRNNSHDMKAARRRARAARSCPSCGAAGERVLVHGEDCQLVRELAAVSGERGADARYFEDNPAARSFTRRITSAEQAEQYLGYPHDPPPSPLTVVQVTSLGPDLRARCFFDPCPPGSPN